MGSATEGEEAGGPSHHPLLGQKCPQEEGEGESGGKIDAEEERAALAVPPAALSSAPLAQAPPF